MSDTMLCRYNSGKKICAIKAVRTVFAMGLKEAKALVEDYDRGFLMTQLQWLALRGEYMLMNGDERRLFINDWMIEPYTVSFPHDMRDAGCVHDRNLAQLEAGSINDVGSVRWDSKTHEYVVDRPCLGDILDAALKERS